MNEKFKEEEGIWRILNKTMGNPWKIKKEKRIKFYNKIKELDLRRKDIFFIGERIMDLIHFVNEKIRLSK